MEFSETLETEWIKADLKMINVRQHSHSPRDVGKLTGHEKNNLEQGTLLALFCVLYVNDGSLTFKDQDQRYMKTVYQDENNDIIDDNSVERKPFINRESECFELTI